MLDTHKDTVAHRKIMLHRTVFEKYFYSTPYFCLIFVLISKTSLPSCDFLFLDNWIYGILSTNPYVAEKQSNIMGSAMMTVYCTVGAINAAIRPTIGTVGAMTHIRNNDTFSRPPTDLRGSSCDICGLLKGQGWSVLRGYDVKPMTAQNIPPCLGAWQIRHMNIKTRHTTFLRSAICGVLLLVQWQTSQKDNKCL